MHKTPTPRFTGIFIPAEILEMKELSVFEKLLLSWIDALYCKDHRGCYASNSYLSEKLNAKENTIAKSIGRFRNMGLIEDVSFDGRIRVIRAMINEAVSKSQSNAGLDENPMQGWTEIQCRVGQKSNAGLDIYPAPQYIESKGDIKETQRKEKHSVCDLFLTFGEDQQVRLTKGQHEKLLKKMPAAERDYWIEQVELEIGKQGVKRFNAKYKSHYHVILSWKKRREENGQPIGKSSGSPEANKELAKEMAENYDAKCQ